MWHLLPLPLTQETEGLLDAGRFETAASQRGARPRVARPATRSRRVHCGSIGLERRTDTLDYFRITEERANAVSVSRTPGISAINCQICRMRSASWDSTRTSKSKSPVITSQATTSGIFRNA